MRVRASGCSEIGNIRTHNEDYWGVDPSGYIFILADGMGGHVGGEIASKKACESVVQSLLPHRTKLNSLADDINPNDKQTLISALKGAMIKAEKDIFEMIQDNPVLKGMATTCDLLFLANATAFITHVGDSRVYLLRGDTGRQLTLDHNVYEYLKSQGRTEEEIALYPHKDKLVRALGMAGGALIDTLQIDLRQGDRIVMCSDGLYRYLKGPTHLAQLYRDMEPQKAAEQLCQYALDCGGEDNITVICIEISDPGTRVGSIETDSKITALENISFFQHLSYQEMLQVMPITFEKNVEAQEIIINKGEIGDALFIITEGSCTVYSDDVQLAILEAGSAFGELSLIDRQPRSATVVANENTSLLVIHANDFEKLTQSGSLAFKILWNVVNELTKRLRFSSEKIKELGMLLKKEQNK